MSVQFNTVFIRVLKLIIFFAVDLTKHKKQI